MDCTFSERYSRGNRIGVYYNDLMSRKRQTIDQSKLERWYRGANIPLAVIRRFAREVAERFQPEKIILFGSYAYGRPHADSDVDILVIMPARNQLDQAFKIHCTIDPPFPLDIIVRTPKHMKWRLEEGDSFLREIVSKGKVLYEAGHARMGAKGRSRSGHRGTTPRCRNVPPGESSTRKLNSPLSRSAGGLTTSQTEEGQWSSAPG